MLTPHQVLTAHQWGEWDSDDPDADDGLPWRCTCGQLQPEGAPGDNDAADLWMANHQLLELTSAGLAIVPVRGTEAVLMAAARVVQARNARPVLAAPSTEALDAYRQRLGDVLDVLERAVHALA